MLRQNCFEFKRTVLAIQAMPILASSEPHKQDTCRAKQLVLKTQHQLTLYFGTYLYLTSVNTGALGS